MLRNSLSFHVSIGFDKLCDFEGVVSFSLGSLLFHLVLVLGGVDRLGSEQLLGRLKCFRLQSANSFRVSNA
jgi:hypothetical protein